jgi:SAM-dependent methyltransferase
MADPSAHPLADRAVVRPDSYGATWAVFLDEWAALNRSVPDADMLHRLDACARQRPSTRVLELGVGTGFVAIPLARRGIPIVGIDGSPEMLERLQRNASGLPVEGVLADFCDFELDERFGLVYFCSSSLYCLPTADAQAACLQAIARHLTDEGRFVITAYLHDDAYYDADGLLETTQSRGDGWRMRWSAIHVPAEQRVLVTRTLQRDGKPDLVFPHQERYLTTEQLDEMAQHAGLRLESRHADWKGTEFQGRGNHVSTYSLSAG